MEKVTICVPTYNNEKTIEETLLSCLSQKYPALEILVCDDGSTDKTLDIVKSFPQVRLHEHGKNIGQGSNLTSFMYLAQGEYLVYMSADDLFTYPKAVKDIADIFDMYPKVGHVSRWYYQFLDGVPGAVRTHRSDNVYSLGNNPSGLAFRKSAMIGEFSNDFFIESVSMVRNVLLIIWDYYIIEKDLVAVRICKSTSTRPEAFEQSPLLLWYGLFGAEDFIVKNYSSLVQVKTWGTYRQLLREIYLFIKLHPINSLYPDFWFYVLLTLLTPRGLLKHLNRFYKHRIGRYFLGRQI